MGNKNPNQCKLILQYMKDHGTITPADAIRDLGVYRLGARIHELREKGFNIITNTVQSVNRYGAAVRFAEYSLGDEN